MTFTATDKLIRRPKVNARAWAGPRREALVRPKVRNLRHHRLFDVLRLVLEGRP